MDTYPYSIFSQQYESGGVSHYMHIIGIDCPNMQTIGVSYANPFDLM